MDDTTALAAPAPLPWWQGTFAHGLLGAVLLAPSFPPADLWPLAWVATLPWLRLIALPQLFGRRPYLALYLAGFVHWLMVLHWLRLPHWTTAGVGVLLCAYLAAYLPLFVGLSRVVVQRWRWSLPLAAVLVWMGLEYLRQWFLTGFSMACLAHTQYRWLALIQAAEFGGATLVSGLVLLPAAWLASALWLPGITRGRLLFDGVIGGGIIAAVLIYGYQELRQPLEPVLRVALIQGSYDTTFEPDVDRITPVMEQYGKLTEAVRIAVDGYSDVTPQLRDTTFRHLVKLATDELTRINNNTPANTPSRELRYKEIDLIVWPESIYRYPVVSFDESFVQPKDMVANPDEFSLSTLERLRDYFALKLLRDFRATGNSAIGVPHLLVGLERMHLYSDTTMKRYNSAAFYPQSAFDLSTINFLNRKKKLEPTQIEFYDKRHLVPCGEFMPFAAWFPWLYQLSPVGGGLEAGGDAKSFEIRREPAFAFRSPNDEYIRISPSICYENVMPQVIRQQMLELHAKNETPDVLVNLSNDGWFFGSSELDLHLVCGVFRAIETRRPMLIAANTGFSAAIDPLGRITAKGRRHEPDILIVDAEVLKDRDRNWLTAYVLHGEIFGKLGLLLCAAVVALQSVLWWRGRRKSPVRE